MNQKNGHGIYSARACYTGAGRIVNLKNLQIVDVKTGYSAINLVNMFFANIENIRIKTYGVGIKLTINEADTIHCGNSLIQNVFISLFANNAKGFEITGGTTYVYNLMQFDRIQIMKAGSYSGQVGMDLTKLWWTVFNAINIEDCDIGVNLTKCRGLKFNGGYIGKGVYDMTAAVCLNEYVRATTFDTVKLEAGTGYDIQDLSTKKYDEVLFINCHSEDTPPNFVLTPQTRIQNWHRFIDYIGVIANPFYDTVFNYELVGNRYTICPIGGSASAPTASRVYVVANVPVLITSTGGTGVNIIIQTQLGNTIASGLTSLTGFYLPVGYSINFGAFSVAPTVTIAGVNS